MKSGWYSGKGFKAYKNERYDDALTYFDLALKYSESEAEPVIFDYMALSYYNLGYLILALEYAEKSLKEYTDLESNKDYKGQGRIRILQNIVIKLKAKI